MKTLRKLFLILFVLLNYSFVTRDQASAQQGFGNFQVFYDELSPYGQWVDYPNYGYVWIPDMGSDFFPYSTGGYWIMTKYGWTWVSDYTWGWAPFHYGRWDYDDFYGWFWVPDNTWGPAWVSWRRANGYYGWTPMRPGINGNLNFGDDYRNINHWNFVEDRYFGRDDLDRHYVNGRDNDRILKNSTVINNTYFDNNRNVTYIAGPQGDDVQRITGRRIRSVAVLDNERPGEILNKGQLRIYRPQVERINDGRPIPTPPRITNLNDIRPVRERNAAYQRTTVTPMENSRREEQQAQPRQQIEHQRQEQPQLQEQQQAQPRQQIERQRQEQPQVQEQQQAKPRQQIERQRQEQPQVQEQQAETQRQVQDKQKDQILQKKEQQSKEDVKSFDNNGRSQLDSGEHHEKSNGENRVNRRAAARRR